MPGSYESMADSPCRKVSFVERAFQEWLLLDDRHLMLQMLVHLATSIAVRVIYEPRRIHGRAIESLLHKRLALSDGRHSAVQLRWLAGQQRAGRGDEKAAGCSGRTSA